MSPENREQVNGGEAVEQSPTDIGVAEAAQVHAGDAATAEGSVATESLEHVFKSLNLKQVFYVDDVFADTGGDGDVIADLVRARSANPEALAALLDDVPLENEELWLQEARTWWDSAGSEDRSRVAQGLEAIIGETKLVLDFAAPEQLEVLLPDFVQFEKVLPAEWPDKRERLRESAPMNRILCLFDVNLGDSEIEGRSRNGIDLLTEALQMDGVEDVFFGLLSTKFTVDNELVEWRTIVADRPELRNYKGRFLPLAKERRDDLVQFAKGLEMMTLNAFCDRLKKAGCEALDVAHKAAVEKIQDLEVFDFEHIVLDGSRKEGAPEADTLFRLFHIFHRDDAKKAMLATDSVRAFNSDVLQARAIREKRVGGTNSPPDQRLEIRHQELYEDGEILNGFHTPLRSGDMFRSADKSRWFILLAPPCNLAVRENGRRRVERVTLIPIKLRTERWVKDTRLQRLEYLDSRAVLKYLWLETPAGGKEPEWMWGVAEFADAAGISTDVLDLAVLNNDGACGIDVDAPALAPDQLHSAWEKRIGALRGSWKATRNRLLNLKTRFQNLPEGDQKQLWTALMPNPADSSIRLTKECLVGSTFDFGLQRLLHYRSPYSTYLLSDYTQYISRNATPFDFALPK